MPVVYTTISPSYCPNWGVQEALRELLQESIDVQTVYGCCSDVRYESGIMVIEDDGPGLPLAALVMGNSGKREHPDTIGQFGEGLKLACLVLARNGREIIIETVGQTLVSMIAVNPDFGCEVLAFDISENSRQSGTRITVSVSADDYEYASSLFLSLTGSQRFSVPLEDGSQRPLTAEDNIFLPGGHLFVQGVAVSVPGVTGEFLFSYNIPAKCVQSRDRWAVDMNTLTKQISELWSQCTNPVLIKQLLTAVAIGDSSIEIANGMVPWNRQLADKDIWKEAAASILGDCLLGSNLPAYQLQRASELGYRVISPHYRIQWFLEDLGVRTVESLEDELSYNDPVPLDDLTPLQFYNLQQIRMLCQDYVFNKGDSVTILPARLADQVAGCYTNGKLYISLDTLDDLFKALQVAVHEYAHHLSKSADYTSSFQNTLERMIVELVLIRASGRNIHA